MNRTYVVGDDPISSIAVAIYLGYLFITMVIGKMHPDEVETNVLLVRQLLQAQFATWTDYPIAPVASAGTDNALYRLGDGMVVRLPRIHWAVNQVHKEHLWLPWLVDQLPLEIPHPLAKGVPGEGYPWHWSIYRWIEGENSAIENVMNPEKAAIDLARFIQALHSVALANRRHWGLPKSSRGCPLIERDPEVRAAIKTLGSTIDAAAATAAWDESVQAPEWSNEPVLIHGDLQSGNLLFRGSALSAVLDFGCLSVGDPAADLMAAWLYLSKNTRPVFRERLQVDDATWTRARGWALSVGLIALPYYRETNPTLAAIALRAIDEVIAEKRDSQRPSSYTGKTSRP